ncbi:MAG: hypothetical protein ACR2OZ_14035 [Verrucomicrobiales bacterium]
MMDPISGRPVHREWGERVPMTARWSPSARTAWIIATVAMVSVCLVVAYYAWRGTQNASIPKPNAAALAGMIDGETPSNYEFVKERILAGIEAAKKVLTAENVDQLLPLVRDREALEPQIRAYYERQAKGTLPIGYQSFAPMDRHTWVAKSQIIIISYMSKERKARAVAFHSRPDGELLADWPSLVALGEVPLADFVAQKETRPRFFRLLGTRDDYFNRSFSNDRDFVCLKLRDLGDKHLLYGYARRDSDAGRAILTARLPVGRGLAAPVTLRMRFPEAAETEDQVEITEFVTTGWLALEDKPGAAPVTPPAAGNTEPTPSSPPVPTPGEPSSPFSSIPGSAAGKD